jgi:hypothetical protein
MPLDEIEELRRGDLGLPEICPWLNIPKNEWHDGLIIVIITTIALGAISPCLDRIPGEEDERLHPQ